MQRVRSLRNRLVGMVERDQEQEVRGIAIPVVDAVLTEARKALSSDDPVLGTISGLVTVETIADGEPVRAVDALLVVDQLLQALSYTSRFNEGPSWAEHFQQCATAP